MNVFTLTAITAAMGLVGLVAVEVVSLSQDSEARGCPVSSVGINASKGRCFRP
jgi:hypothetical protein